MYYLLVVIIPIILLIIWFVYKDRQELKEVSPQWEDLTDQNIKTPEFQRYYNLLKQSDLRVNIDSEDGDLDYSPAAIDRIDSNLLELGHAYAVYQRTNPRMGNLSPAEEQAIPKQDKLEHAVYCTARLVRLAKMGDTTTLANLIGWSTKTLPEVNGFDVVRQGEF